MTSDVSTPSRISETFSQLKSSGKMAFMPFITAGDPDLELTQLAIKELAHAGVDLIEVGFPYSDPIADGPVIQASYTRALDQGFQIKDLFTAIAELKETPDLPPLVGMVAFSIVFRMGPETFIRTAAEAGFSGLIIPDLPGDEAGEFSELVKSHGLDLIELIAPTTPKARVEKILAAGSGFVYCISVAGTTGTRDELPAELKDQLAWLRTQTDLPLAVGFGISQPDQVDGLRGAADGVIVGSALVKQFAKLHDGTATREEVLQEIATFAESMVAKTSQVG